MACIAVRHSTPESSSSNRRTRGPQYASYGHERERCKEFNRRAHASLGFWQHTDSLTFTLRRTRYQSMIHFLHVIVMVRECQRDLF
jgi:hypothetical protein